MKTKNISDILTTNYYKNKNEYIFHTKNINQFSENSLHAIVYVNHQNKEIFIHIRGTKIILSTSIFDQNDITDCIKLKKNESISKIKDLNQLALFLHKNIHNLDAYNICISGHSLGAICADLLAILMKKLILKKKYYKKLNIASITFDNPGSLNQIKKNLSLNNVRRIMSGINFHIIQNGVTAINSSLPQITNRFIKINFLLDKYKINDNKSNMIRNSIINFFANVLNNKINHNSDTIVNTTDYNLHLFENIYNGVINKYSPQNSNKIKEYLHPIEIHLNNLITKQNINNQDSEYLHTEEYNYINTYLS